MELVVDCGVKVNNAVLNAKPLDAPLQEGSPHIDIETFVHVRVLLFSYLGEGNFNPSVYRSCSDHLLTILILGHLFL